jgi:hypothetical protein
MPDTTINFITLRQPQRINEKVKRLRYIQDIRSSALAPIREQLKGADGIGQKLFIAQAFKSTPVFFTPDYYYNLKKAKASPIPRRTQETPTCTIPTQTNRPWPRRSIPSSSIRGII